MYDAPLRLVSEPLFLWLVDDETVLIHKPSEQLVHVGLALDSMVLGDFPQLISAQSLVLNDCTHDNLCWKERPIRIQLAIGG